MIKYSKKERGTEMENKEIQEEIIVDYVAKGSVEKTKKLIPKEYSVLGISIAYMSYTGYCLIRVLNEKQMSTESFYGLPLMLFLMFVIPIIFICVLLPDESVAPKIEAVKKFLLEAGQEASKENINILLNRYYKGNWQKIEDMLYEKRKVFSAESMELVSRNTTENLKEALPAK